MAEDYPGFGPPVDEADIPARATPVQYSGFGPPVKRKEPILAPGEVVGIPEETYPGFGKPVQTEPKPMPGIVEALTQGIGAGIGELPGSAQALRGERPDIAPETSPAAEGLGWGDVTSPFSRLLPKVMYGLGKGAPTVGAGVIGGLAGGMAAGPPGALAVGAAGAGLGAAFQALGPYFKDELNKSPGDPDGAYNRAMERAGASGVFSALGWAAFPLRIAQGPLKQLAFQAFGVQPAVSVAETAAQSAIQGKPVTAEDLGRAYGTGAAFTALPMAGHAALGALGGLGRAEPQVRHPEPVRTVADLRASIADAETRQADLQNLIDSKIPHPVSGEDFRNLPPDIQGRILDQRDEATQRIRQTKKQLASTPDKADMAPAYREIDMKAPIPEAGPDPSFWDNFSFGQHIKNALYRKDRLLTPEAVSDLALKAFGEFRNFVGASAQRRDSILAVQAKMHDVFERIPYDQQIAFIRGAEREAGFVVTPEFKPYYDEFRRLLDMVKIEDQNVGAKYGYLEDYFPREWVQPERASQFIAARYPSQGMGSPGFQKARTYDFLQEGLDAGLVLKNSNPADLVTNRLLGSAAVQEKVKLIQRLNQIGAAARLRNPGDVSAASSAGWHMIKDPVGDQWAIHPDLKPMWDNVIADKGLWDNPNTAGNAFRKWMAFKNFYVPIKLSLSAFHPLHVAHINFVNGMRRGWDQLTEARDPVGAFKTAAKGITQLAQAGIPYMPMEAKAARQAWLTPEWRQTPEQKAVVKLMTEGGFSPQLSEQLRMKHSQAFKDAWANQQYHRMVLPAAYEFMRHTQGLIFEHWIPSLKTAAYLDEARALFERRPDLNDNPIQRKAALSEIAKSVDNRYGEMFYRGLFWNKALKDAGIGSFLSLGWNLGFVREFGGGALEPFMNRALDTPTKEAISAARSKTSFAFAYMATAMAINAAMTKLMSGDNPEGMDYYMPRIGGPPNPDGSPRRVSNMFYTREIPMAGKHVEERGGWDAPEHVVAGLGQMLWNKMMFEPLNEFINNRDYYGYNIMDPSSPWYQRYAQMAKFIASDQFNPITLSGAKRALQAVGKWNVDDSAGQKLWKILSEPEGQLAMAGFGPAPSYAAKTPVLNRLYHLFSEYVSPHERPMKEREIMEGRRDARNELAIAQREGDPERAASAAQKLSDLGVSAAARKRVKPGTQDIYMFTRLPYTIQTQFLKELSKEDFRRYYPKANKNTKFDPEIREIVGRYYQ